MNQGLHATHAEEWSAPRAVYQPLDAEFHFTLDACATADNAKCPRYFTKDQDGLDQAWGEETVWCNPPFRDVAAWVRKASIEKGATTVLLVPSRTDTDWWHRYVWTKAEIRWIRGRLRFNAKANAPFPCCIIVFRRRA